MTAQVGLLVNPTAGKGRAARSVADVVGALREASLDVSVLIGHDVAHAEAMAADAVANGAAALVALGGDGMAHLALNALAGTNTAMGIVPAGTGNDLAATLGLPLKDPVMAARHLAARLRDGGGRPMDAIRVGERWFGCVLGAGFDSRVNDRANRLSWPRGRMRYNIAMVAELRVFRPLPFRITIDDDEPWETEAMLVAVGNARSYGAGMQVCPNADVTDGLLDITVLGPVSKPEFLRAFPRVYKGTHVDHPAVTVRQAKQVTIDSPGVTAYADGEFLTELPAACECVPGAVTILA